MIIKDIINPVKWVHYVRFLIRKLFGKLKYEAGYRTPEDMAWQSEVITYRSLLCSDCKTEGKCVGIAEGESEACGCDFIGKSTDMSLECSCGLWKAVKNKEDWEQQKEKYYSNIKINFTNEF